MAEIVRTIELDNQAAETGWSALVQTPGNRKRTFIAVCIGAFAQWNVRFALEYTLDYLPLFTAVY
jgi:hypothetical protein